MGRVIRHEGRAMTDIDAIAYRGGTCCFATPKRGLPLDDMSTATTMRYTTAQGARSVAPDVVVAGVLL
jgi:hypothetical protein